MRTTVLVLLQDRESGLYFKKAGEWTAEIGEAADFKQIVPAVDCARQIGGKTLDILMTFGDPAHDVRIAAMP
jgi:hypothetical protein